MLKNNKISSKYAGVRRFKTTSRYALHHLFIPYNCIYAQPSSNTNTRSLCAEVETNFILAELLAPGKAFTPGAKSGQVVGKGVKSYKFYAATTSSKTYPPNDDYEEKGGSFVERSFCTPSRKSVHDVEMWKPLTKSRRCCKRG